MHLSPPFSLYHYRSHFTPVITSFDIHDWYDLSVWPLSERVGRRIDLQTFEKIIQPLEEVEKAIIARRNPTHGLEFIRHRGTGRTAYARTYCKGGIDPNGMDGPGEWLEIAAQTLILGERVTDSSHPTSRLHVCISYGTCVASGSVHAASLSPSDSASCASIPPRAETKHRTVTDAYLFIRKPHTNDNDTFDGQVESVSVGMYACARPQGTNDGASCGEEECDEADVYARMAARAVGQVKEKEEGDGVVATSKYCTKVIEDDEDDEEENKQPGKQKLSPLLVSIKEQGFQRRVGPVGKGKQGLGAWGANKTLTSEINGASGAHHAATESSKCREIGWVALAEFESLKIFSGGPEGVFRVVSGRRIHRVLEYDVPWAVLAFSDEYNLPEGFTTHIRSFRSSVTPLPDTTNGSPHSTWHTRLVINEEHATGPYESDGRRMDVRLGLEDRVIAQLYTFDKAFGASGFDEHIYPRPFTQLRGIDTTVTTPPNSSGGYHCNLLLQPLEDGTAKRFSTHSFAIRPSPNDV
ncbi:hypothetical protein BGY98DRAFT_939362 [Russula aff. rugulosa BPL654]|nr:hypothetical protein BGY98DRAFT_939362 [Russula aff. rugulosa BPL654]